MKNQKNQSLIYALGASQDITWFQRLRVSVCFLGEGRKGGGRFTIQGHRLPKQPKTSNRDLPVCGNILILQSKNENL